MDAGAGDRGCVHEREKISRRGASVRDGGVGAPSMLSQLGVVAIGRMISPARHILAPLEVALRLTGGRQSSTLCLIECVCLLLTYRRTASLIIQKLISLTARHPT